MAFRSNWIDVVTLISVTQGCMDIINRLKVAKHCSLLKLWGEYGRNSSFSSCVKMCRDC